MFQLLINIMPLFFINKIKYMNKQKFNISENRMTNTNIDYVLYSETIVNNGFQRTNDL